MLNSSIYTYLEVGDHILERTDEEIINLFYKLTSRESVANLLEINDRSLRYFLYSTKNNNFYRTFKLKKKSGGERVILAPSVELKQIQKKLAYILNLIYKPKICTYGFVKDRNIVDNAKCHSNTNLVFNIDLKDFFNQIHFGRVRGMFLSKPYEIGEEASTTFAQLACYNGILPQGAPSSPIITNMICRPLDNRLINLAKKYGMHYSRYADDITFSTYKKSFPKGLVEGDLNSLSVGKELLGILNKNGFNVNSDKIYLNTKFKRQEVTGLVVNKFPNLKREYIKEIRAILHNCEKHGMYKEAKKYIIKGKCKNQNIISKVSNVEYKNDIVEWFEEVLKGKINHIRVVRGDDNHIFLKYAKQLNEISGRNIFDTSLLDSLNERISQNVFIVQSKDTDNMYNQGTCFILKGYGIITSYHVTEDGSFYNIYSHDEYDDNSICIIAKDINEDKSNETIDYALYGIKKGDASAFEIGDSDELKLGDKVTIIGYPDYNKNDSPYIHSCNITSIKNKYHGSRLVTVSGRIIHGSSGGPVLNDKNEVIGLIKGGIVSLDKEFDSNNQGFIPINDILEDINK